MAVRKLIQVGDSALKESNKKITSFNSSTAKKLIKDLTDTMYKTGLAGIAAPQIGENSQFLSRIPETQNQENFLRKTFCGFLLTRKL
jgi:peptide deformylase